MRRMTHFEAVQVVERWPDGRLKAWYGGDRRATLSEAREVIEKTVIEIGTEVKGRIVA